MVGGVWLHSDGVPDVAVINLVTRCCVEFRLDRVIQSPQAVLCQVCSGLLRKGGKPTCVVASPGLHSLAPDAALVLLGDHRPRRTRAAPARWWRELLLLRDPL